MQNRLQCSTVPLLTTQGHSLQIPHGIGITYTLYSGRLLSSDATSRPYRVCACLPLGSHRPRRGCSHWVREFRNLRAVTPSHVLRDRYLADWSVCILDPCAYRQLAIHPPLIRRAICSRCPVWPRVLIPGLGSYLMCAALLALSVVCRVFPRFACRCLFALSGTNYTPLTEGVKYIDRIFFHLMSLLLKKLVNSRG